MVDYSSTFELLRKDMSSTIQPELYGKPGMGKSTNPKVKMPFYPISYNTETNTETHYVPPVTKRIKTYKIGKYEIAISKIIE